MMFEKTDPRGKKIVLKKSTWEYKILNYHHTNDDGKHGNSHPEMVDYLEEIVNCIEKPHLILQDMKIARDEHGQEIEIPNESREEYFRFFSDKVKKRVSIIKTIVEFDDTMEKGDIVTAHKVKSVKGGKILYDATDTE